MEAVSAKMFINTYRIVAPDNIIRPDDDGKGWYVEFSPENSEPNYTSWSKVSPKGEINALSYIASTEGDTIAVKDGVYYFDVFLGFGSGDDRIVLKDPLNAKVFEGVSVFNFRRFGNDKIVLEGIESDDELARAATYIGWTVKGERFIASRHPEVAKEIPFCFNFCGPADLSSGPHKEPRSDLGIGSSTWEGDSSDWEVLLVDYLYILKDKGVEDAQHLFPVTFEDYWHCNPADYIPDNPIIEDIFLFS